MPENSTTGKAGAAAPPAAGFEAFFSTRVWAAAESSRSPTSAVVTDGDGALVAALAFLRQDIRARDETRRRFACGTRSAGGRLLLEDKIGGGSLLGIRAHAATPLC